ncbi:MAG: DNA-directed RNA polymerase subunit H [Candidatus Aenigmarchaeota archaeon]|nr:DNA-directed RNA polymerase subunit H [Candidatus Aenigmarchaeota archaeon]
MPEEQEIEFNIFESQLVPKQEVMSEDEKASFLKQFNIGLKQLPRIRQDDPAAKKLAAKKGDVIKITRNDPGVGEYFYYRVVV